MLNKEKEESKSILFVIGSLAKGGAEKNISILANYFSLKGHKVTIGLIGNERIEYVIDSSVDVISLLNDNGKNSKIFGKLGNLKRLIKSRKIDYVISFTTGVNIYCLILKLFFKYKLIISERNNPKYDPKDFLSRFLRRMLYRFSDGFVFQTIQARDFFSKNIRNRSVVISNPINKGLINLEKQSFDKNILAVGRLEGQKNYKFIIEAFSLSKAIEKEYKLLILGEGSLRVNLESYIDGLRLGDHVKLLGSDYNWHLKYLKSRIFINCSHYEGMPNSVLEAKAMGIPCIVNYKSTDAISEIFEHEFDGILIENNINEVLESINRLIVDDELVRKLSKNAKLSMSKYLIENIYSSWVNYLASI